MCTWRRVIFEKGACLSNRRLQVEYLYSAGVERNPLFGVLGLVWRGFDPHLLWALKHYATSLVRDVELDGSVSKKGNDHAARRLQLL